MTIRTSTGFLWAASILAGVTYTSAARGESLADALALAYQTNPTLLGQRAQLRVTDETYVQARAGYRTQASIQVSATRQDYQRQTTNSGQAGLTLTQPLYTGGRTASAISASEADILAGRETLRGQEATVLAQVIQAYADVVRDQEDVGIREANVKALTDQLTEITARSKQGDLTRTDVAQSQGYLFQARVDLASQKAQLETSLAAYGAVVGQRPGVLEPLPPLPNLPTTLNQAFATAELGNPNLRSALYTEQGAKLRTAEARDQRLPSITLRMQYGYNGPGTASFVPTPNIYPKDAAAMVTFTQPLLAGGTIDSQIRQGIERQAAARMQTEASRRTMVQQISQAWNALQADVENVTNAGEEVRADAVAYEGVQKESRADLRTTAEVLYIEQSLRQAELSRAGAKHDAYIAATSLLGSMGLLEAEQLVPGINLYDPAKAFNKVKWAGVLPWELFPAALDRLTAPPLQKLPSPPKTLAPVPAP